MVASPSAVVNRGIWGYLQNLGKQTDTLISPALDIPKERNI